MTTPGATEAPRLKKGDQVRVSAEGKRNGIQVRRHGKDRVGTVMRTSGDSIDVRWDGTIHTYSINARFIEHHP